MEKINIHASDGITIVGDYNRSKFPVCVLFLHMMPSTRKSYRQFSKKVNDLGLGSLAIDLRGHGDSDKGPSGFMWFKDEDHQKSILDVRAAIEFLKEQGFDEIFIVGASIGANLALQYMSESDFVSKIILLSPGINYRGIKTLPLAKKISSNKSTYVVAAKDDIRKDGNTADKMAMELYDSLSCKKQIKIFESGGHGTDILQNSPEFIDNLIDWLMNS